MSQRTPNPFGVWNAVIVPGLGAKLRYGSSALIRHSMAHPTGDWLPKVILSPPAMRSCHSMRSVSVTSSVAQCSTWMRVFISMK